MLEEIPSSECLRPSRNFFFLFVFKRISETGKVVAASDEQSHERTWRVRTRAALLPPFDVLAVVTTDVFLMGSLVSRSPRGGKRRRDKENKGHPVQSPKL